MRVLVLGGLGMAGHLAVEALACEPELDIAYAWRTQPSPAAHRFMQAVSARGFQLELADEQELEKLLAAVQPEVVINCAGILNEQASRNLEAAIRVNSLLPHALARLSEQCGFYLIHLSTDCVFSGSKGGYTEADTPDGTSDYARTKLLGEVRQAPHATLRTSIIGPELRPNGRGLFEWFMRQTGAIPGYAQVWWTGLTTLELAKALKWAIESRPAGLLQLAPTCKISKFSLLKLLQDTFGKQDVRIVPVQEPASDKSLIQTPGLTYQAPDYPQMIAELQAWMADRSWGVQP